jgi:capsular exopolysaccharide synthesis family protein
VHHVFNHPLTPGLGEALEGSIQTKMTIRPTLVPGLSILPAGSHSGNPGAILASAEFKVCLEALAREFDLIVLDSPPVLAVGDAAVVAAEASGILFVVSAQSTRRQTALAALQRLDVTGVPLLGVVLNQVDVEGHPYYYDPYYRREYKSYYIHANTVTDEHPDKSAWH